MKEIKFRPTHFFEENIYSLTKGWLQHSSMLLTMSNRVDLIIAVYQAPEVVLVVRAIKPESQPRA